MFQLACGYALARKFSMNLVLDTEFFLRTGVDSQRRYELDGFGLTASGLQRQGLGEISAARVQILEEKPNKARFFLRAVRETTIREGGLTPAQIVSMDRASSYFLEGYWQSVKYFNGFETEIKRIFRAPKIPNSARIIRPGPTAPAENIYR